MTADVHLEHVGAPLREFTDRVRRLGKWRLDRMLVDHTISSAADRQREHWHDRGAGPERNRGERRGRCRRPLEEIDVDGVTTLNVLIDEDRDALTRLQHPHNAADRALPVDDDVAGALANLLEERVEIGVVERARARQSARAAARERSRATPKSQSGQ